MTLCRRRKYEKSVIKSVVSTILIFLFAIVSSIVLISEKRKLRPFDERLFYFVCAGSAQSAAHLEGKKELLKNLGGASVIYKRNDISYVIANVYLDQVSADEIKVNLSNYFQEVSVLKLKSKRVSNKNIREIKKIDGLEVFIKYLYKVSNEFQNLQMLILKGECSEGEFLSEMVKRRINLEKLLSEIDKLEKLAESVFAFGEVMCLQLSSFLNGFTIAKNKQNYICNYFVGFFLNYVELFDSL